MSTSTACSTTPKRTGKSFSARHPMPRPSSRFSAEGGLEIEKTDSTTVKPIAEPYLLASVNFYRTAIISYKVYIFISLLLTKSLIVLVWHLNIYLILLICIPFNKLTSSERPLTILPSS